VVSVKKGSAAVQGELWGARARDWAEANEPAWRQVFEIAVDKTGIVPGAKFLDIGCGAGGLLVEARARGAVPSGLDASANLVAIARQRLPGARIEVGEMEDLPFADASFDVVVGINSFQFAADIGAALREAGRVQSPRGTFLIVVWGRREDCEFISGTVSAVLALLPPSPAPASPTRPLSDDGVLESTVESAGWTVTASGSFEAPLRFPGDAAAVRAILSASARAIRHAGEPAVETAVRTTLPRFTAPDGSLSWRNRFRWATATR
jgi:SAM-dependent methyltransferase